MKKEAGLEEKEKNANSIAQFSYVGGGDDMRL
jgi:hypothetical protein